VSVVSVVFLFNVGILILLFVMLLVVVAIFLSSKAKFMLCL
jgi:hypothetical protein